MGEALFPDPGQDFQAQADKLARRRKLAEQLVSQAMQGDGGQGYHNGRIYAVGNQLGNVVQNVVGQFMGNQLDQQAQDLASRQATAQNAFADEMAAADTPAAKQAALVNARNRGLRHDLEKSFYELDAKQNEAEAIRQAKAAELAAQKEAERQWREQQAQAQRDFVASQNQMYKRTADQLGARGAATDAEMVGLKKDMLRAQIEAAADKHSVTAAKPNPATDAAEVLNLLEQAKPLLAGSTSSGAGALVDKAAGFVGMSTPGADKAAQLAALGGALVARMPKMSGPQSDKDVALYKEMAGRIGDPTVPTSQKQAAMETIREINQRHASGDTATQQQPIRRRFNPATGRVE